jgi:fructuronate reductase
LRRLSQATLAQARPAVRLPRYDRSEVRIGVVHLGPGAFHRAHQAFYLDRLLEQDRRWAEVAVSLKSPGVREALEPQDGLYALAEVEEEPALQVIGAIRQVLTAPEDTEAVLAHLASPDVRLWTLTITEKGYCLTPSGELDAAHPDIRADLAAPRTPTSAIGYLVEGLRRRRLAGLAPPAVISCDNLADNGTRLGHAVIQLARETDPDLARWIEGETRFPRTMVDSITPATDEALRARVADELGLADAWPVQRERFVQWVIEDVLPPGGPDLGSVGVELTNDVAAHEQAKLRLLNGAHSTLAYIGLARGHETVAQAMADPDLAAFVRELMWTDIMPTLRAPPGLELAAYAESLLTRFRNRAIRHQLSQIAWDGSQKLPFRLLGTIADALAAGRPVDRLAQPIAAWMKFVVQRAKAGVTIVDPLADELTALGRRAEVKGFLELGQVFPADLARNPKFVQAVEAAFGAGLSRLFR